MDAGQLRHALGEELPSIVFDDDMVEFMSGVLVQGVSDEEVSQSWEPFLISNKAAHDDHSASEVSARILRRLRNGGATNGGAAPASGGAAGDTAVVPPTTVSAVSSTASDTVVDGRTGSQVTGLSQWIERLKLVSYDEAIRSWCAQEGITEVEEVARRWEDLSKAIKFKTLDLRRLAKECSGASATPTVASSRKASAARWFGRETFGPPGNKQQYVLLEELGNGVSATVYRCVKRDDPQELEFAAKVISLSKFRLQCDAERLLEKTGREAAIMKQLRHSNIVTLYDVVETPFKLYLVMELVEGGELFHEITKDGRLPESEARYVFLQLADALRYIHSMQVAHRDLKPENILVDKRTSTPGKLKVKISDFGLAKLIGSGYDKLVTQVGTPQYWAPEVSDEEKCARGYNEKVDLWSLGVVLYVMLEGQYPFEDPSDTGRLEEQAKRIRFDDAKGTSQEARDLIRSLIQVRPERRLALDECVRHPWVRVGQSIPEDSPAPNDEGESIARVGGYLAAAAAAPAAAAAGAGPAGRKSGVAGGGYGGAAAKNSTAKSGAGGGYGGGAPPKAGGKKR